MGNEKLTLIQYPSEEAAQASFLGYYCGEAKFSRPVAIDRAGLETRRVNKWFRDVAFFEILERGLKASLRKKSTIREEVLNKTLMISRAKLTDCFFC